jgi:hemerythrin
MSLIEWDNSKYSVGFVDIDNQHKVLVNILNKLHDAMREGKGKEQIEKTLNDLIEYTKTHFAFEENLMNLHNYPEINAHKKDHSDLIQSIRDFQQKVNSNSITLTLEVKNFLRDWLLIHIGKRDKDLGIFLKSNI